MATNGYCTVVDFKDWRSGPDDAIDDARIDDAIGAASRSVDNFCKTRFWQTDPATIRMFDSCDGRLLRIDDAAAITQVATDVDGDGVFEVVWTANDYQPLPVNADAAPEPRPYSQIRAVGGLRFPRSSATGRVGRSEVTGTWGWPAIPDAVFQATLLIVSRLAKRPGSPEGVAGFDEFGVIRISSRDDPDAVRLLTPYKTSRRVGGWAIT
jgi:hypothetical protein